VADYVVITPVRNEAQHFPHTITSMVAQTLRPLRNRKNSPQFLA